MSDLDDLWDFDEIDDEIEEFIPEITFNKIETRPKHISQREEKKLPPTAEEVTKLALQTKLEARVVERCKECGALKQPRKDGRQSPVEGKVRMVCTYCKNKKRVEANRRKREAK